MFCYISSAGFMKYHLIWSCVTTDIKCIMIINELNSKLIKKSRPISVELYNPLKHTSKEKFILHSTKKSRISHSNEVRLSLCVIQFTDHKTGIQVAHVFSDSSWASTMSCPWFWRWLSPPDWLYWSELCRDHADYSGRWSHVWE